MSLIEELFSRPQFSIPQCEKEKILFEGLVELDRYHVENSAAYARIVRSMGWHEERAASVDQLGWLPVGLFKSHILRSVAEDDVVSVIRSSGTTDQTVSQVFLDRTTANAQSRALAKIMGHILGPRRRPMIIVDAESLLSDGSSFSARGAGVLGLMRHGRDHCFVLSDDFKLRPEALSAFLAEHEGEEILIFGFTFMIYQYLLAGLQQGGFDLSDAVLIHSGGWKRLQEESVTNQRFKEMLHEAAGITQVYNFYGMAEQVGSVFLEGEDGFLYPPNFADVIIRDPVTWKEAETGQEGVIQVISLLPASYPGHSLLTEDRGVVHGIDDSHCGRMGKRFEVLGRVPRAELRGCSDVHAVMESA